MSVNATLARYKSEGSKEPSWHLYEDVFETGVVYLQLQGVAIDFTTIADAEHGLGTVVLRLPVHTAQQLGLHTPVPADLWAKACDADK
ncbi:hypothetical protein [Caballeronia sp. ATUFL_F2_KS9A]|uniref:hypothetical protein n=1 Tax=Caballeronia sp. ATUFL_F2_KS9A TaxID=2921777 RepID=UPI002027AE71|nr:hypothetical protein [Caballeronia sp. ATUFL_F2_KS9A]